MLTGFLIFLSEYDASEIKKQKETIFTNLKAKVKNLLHEKRKSLEDMKKMKK